MPNLFVKSFWEDLFRESKPEIYNQAWLEIEILSHDIIAGTDGIEKSEIDKLIEEHKNSRLTNSTATNWGALNRTELLIAKCLPEKKIRFEFEYLLALAKERKISRLDFHTGNYARYFNSVDRTSDTAPPANGVATLDDQRNCYLALLADLQSNFVEQRFGRELRRKTASKLILLGLLLIFAAIVPILVFWYFHFDDSLVTFAEQATHGRLGYGLSLIAAFGLIGAFFSRLLKFQQDNAALGFNDVEMFFGWRVLGARLLFGMLGALLFYFFIKSRLLVGDIFPVLDNPATTIAQIPQAAQIPATSNLARLFVWSFISGFSERLIPDTIGKTEGTNK